MARPTCVLLLAISGVTAVPNDDTCLDANDNQCDDGGQGYMFSHCACGTDLTDCGTRTSTTAGEGDCVETAPANTNFCVSASDGECDDGGVGMQYSTCRCGSDLTDCGYRTGPYSTGNCLPALVPNRNVLEVCHFNLEDGYCDDGGTDSEFAVCPCGTDLTDCGYRRALDNITGDCILEEEEKPCFARSTTACRLVDTYASTTAAFGACFGDDANPAVAERVPMASLASGDLVLSSPHATTRVLVNQHRAEEAAATVAPMVRIRHTHGTLTLTPDHVLLVDGAFQPARLVARGSRLEPASSVVTSVTATSDAIVNPLTTSGTILAAGPEGAPVVASCFPEWIADLALGSTLYPLPHSLTAVASYLFPRAVQTYHDALLEPFFAATATRLEGVRAAVPAPVALAILFCFDVVLVGGFVLWSALSLRGVVAALLAVGVVARSRRKQSSSSA